MISLQDFSGLLKAAREQAEPQRLLFVFAAAELPRDASSEEKLAFERGEGGTLTPTLCVDKAAADVHDFASLAAESAHTGIGWDILFVAALPGHGGHPPSADEAVQPLRLMVEAIKGGRIASFLAVNREGELVQLARA